MTTEIKITHELLKSWNPCTDGFKRFCQLFPEGADLETAINGLVVDDHDDWGFWLFSKCREQELFKEVVAKGYRNSGDWNSGDRNSGGRNSGDWNSGDWNSGYRNSGDRNSGGRNSGDWNSGSRHTGFFNTINQDEILVFNKPCKVSVWENAHKPRCLFFELTYWVSESQMTDEDKINDPNFYVRGGQLRKRDYKEAFKLSWDNADHEDRIKVKELPNFDAQLFFEISGIDLR